ncbi:MAG: hypothetical protein K2G78_01560 [Muribaculaceae bacterium]|nr:hypothetical protein [Muribaculaceae bacterium]
MTDSINLQSDSLQNQIATIPTDSSAAAEESMATTQIDSSDYSAQSGESLTGWVAWGAIALSICTAIILLRCYSFLKHRLHQLERNVSDMDARSKDDLSQIQDLSSRINSLEQRIDNLGARRATVSVAHDIIDNPKHRNVVGNTEISPAKTSRLVRYATLQAPDENGVLRFAERSMTEISSPEKMFLLEIDSASGTGEYRINPSAMQFILSDLQMFRDFVKPFSFSGNPATASIQDKTYGQIIKSGNYWVVSEKLEISIH